MPSVIAASAWSSDMLSQRFLSAIPLMTVALWSIYAGGIWLYIFIAVMWGLCILEYEQLVARRGHRAFRFILLLWLLMFMADRLWPWLGILWPGVSLLLLLTLIRALLLYPQDSSNAIVGFALTLAGGFYFGWTAAHFIAIRALPDGMYWMLVVVFAVWGSDTAAYLIGQVYGRTPLAKEISPKKTWEGYIGGVVAATLVSGAFVRLWQTWGATTMTVTEGLLVSLIISAICPIGDLGMSMFKRYAGAKDSSQLIPGHGGVLDRLDAMMIGGILGYYLILLVLQ
jgi:phosphatidate cytidylyltransferase